MKTQNKANVVHMAYGSHLYGTSTPKSDIDFAGIYMPSFQDLILQKPMKTTEHSTGDPNGRNTKDDIDTKSYSLPGFVKDCLKGDTTVLDMLHCDTPLTTSWIFIELRANRDRFYSKNMKAYVGYVKSQAHKYGLKGDKLAELKRSIDYLKSVDPELRIGSTETIAKLPVGEYIKWYTDSDNNDYYEVLSAKYSVCNSCGYVLEQLKKKWATYGYRSIQAMNNDGMDWKALSHALRVAYQIRAILEHGDFEYPLKETPFIMKVKMGNASYGKEIAPELDKLLDQITDLTERSSLPKEPDYEWWDEWLLGVYELWFNLVWEDR